ncbi:MULTISPECIES: zinc ribbon domain-containing protein [unclassified Luteococcus]|uniref:zinc ribbon domain-containing protein n=1 Tax=unclassified Luteococcus TaxID=2639923 RepID=UPI00313BD702
MLAEPADQMRLLDLAAVDLQVNQLQHRRRTLPELETIKTLMAERATLVENQVAAQTRLSDAQADAKRIEDDLNPARERLARNQKRVDDGSIGDPKALRSLTEEIEHLGGRINKLEDDELDAMQVVEDLGIEVDRLTMQRKELEDRIRALMAKRDSQLADLDAELAERHKEREAHVRLLPAPLVATYDKLSARMGIGAAELKQRRCTGCQLEANLADLRRYAAAPANEVLRCEECDRILVRTKESGLPD